VTCDLCARGVELNGQSQTISGAVDFSVWMAIRRWPGAAGLSDAELSQSIVEAGIAALGIPTADASARRRGAAR
jgi:hypothetical protein